MDQNNHPSKIRYRMAHELREAVENTEKIVILDFLVGMSMMAAGMPIFGIFPVSIFTIGILCAVAIQRKPKYEVKYLPFFLFISTLSVVWVFGESIFLNDIPLLDASKRALRILLLFLFVSLIADKRVDFKSFVFGLGLGLAINVFGFYAGIAPDNYGGVLTGWLSDKNKAGIFYAIGGLLMVTQVNKKWHKVFAVIVFSACLWLTGSRTSMGAFFFGLVWLFLAHKLNFILKIGLAAFVAWGIDYLTVNFSRVGVFSNREGSDILREKIDEMSKIKLENSPWYGQGLGSAKVDLADNTFFFHNSFWTMLVEGGWIYLTLIVFVMILSGFLWKQPTTSRVLSAEAGIVILAVCGWRLGEVFLTETWAMVMGLALMLLARPKDEPYLKRINANEYK